MMVTIWADFNAQTEDGAVRLNTRGSLESLAAHPSAPPDWVVLTDGEVSVLARLDTIQGILVGWPDWAAEDVT